MSTFFVTPLMLLYLRKYSDSHPNAWQFSEMFKDNEKWEPLDRMRATSVVLEDQKLLKRIPAIGQSYGSKTYAFKLTSRGMAVLDKSRLLQLSAIRVRRL